MSNQITFIIIFFSVLFTTYILRAEEILEVKIKDEWVEAASAGIVSLTEIDTSIKVDLKYSTKDNFLHEILYDNLTDCVLQKSASVKLNKAQHYLDSIKPGYSLVVFDALRPRSAQFKMWDIVKGTPQQMYVGNPHSGSIHNFGAAVDVSIVDDCGKEIDMGTPFDYFGDLAQPRHESRFLSEGKLTAAQISNRELLRTVMKMAGFVGIAIEWWHYDAFTKQYIKENYPAIEDLRYSGVKK